MREQLTSHRVVCPVAIRELGQCLSNRGDMDESEKLLRKALDMTKTACPHDKASIADSELSSCLFVACDSIIVPVEPVEQLLRFPGYHSLSVFQQIFYGSNCYSYRNKHHSS